MKPTDRLGRIATAAEILREMSETSKPPPTGQGAPPAVTTPPTGSGRVVGHPGVNGGPIIIVDTREQTPLRFSNLPTVTSALQSGDYSVAGWEEHFTVERKSVADLAASLTRDRDRFARECHRLRGYGFARLLVVGSPDELATLRGNVNPRTVLCGLAAFEVRYRLPVRWCPTPAAAALWVERAAFWFWRESMRPAGIHPQTPPWAISYQP